MNAKIILWVFLALILGAGGYVFYMQDYSSDTEDTEMSENEEVNTDDTEYSGGSQTTSQPERDENGAYIVRYTDEGFIPFIVEVEQGGSVVFRNESTKSLQVTTENHPTAKNQPYAGFDNSTSLANGEEWGLVMLNTGAFGYKNRFNEKHLGAIVVTKQQ